MMKGGPRRLVIGLAALLLGCGTSDGGTSATGGGGIGGAGGIGAVGGVGGSPVTTPVVIETVPEGMATTVATDTTLQASFNTPLDATTVTMTSFRVRRADGAPLAGTVTVDATGLVAIFTPGGPLALSSSYIATLTTQIRSVSGGALETTFEWSFTTRDGAWTDAEPIDLGDTEARSPDVSMDASGNAIAVWSQNEGSDFQVWANRLAAVLGWGEAASIGGGGAAGTARVAVDAEGNAVAVWDGASEMTRNIWANRYSPNDAWQGGESIENEPGDAEAARVATDASGNAIAVWRQQEGARFDIWANRLDRAAGWGDAEKIEVNDAGNANFPQLAVAAQGNAMVVWGQSDGSRINIWANRFTLGGVWENAVIIERRDGSASLPDVGVGSDGSAIAVWTQGTTVTNIWSNRFTRENRWGDAQLIEMDDAGDARDVHVVVDPPGNAHAVWQQSDGSVTSIWSNRFEPESGWGEAELIENDDAGDADSPRVAGDPRGNVIAVWSQSDGAVQNIWANRFIPANGWGSPQLLEIGDAGDAVAPQVAIDPGGRAVVVWSYFDGARSGVWASRFE